MLITLLKKDFVPRGRMSVSDVFLDTEFKCISTNSLITHTFPWVKVSQVMKIRYAKKKYGLWSNIFGSLFFQWTTSADTRDMHNIICHFNLSKKQSKLLGSRLKDLLCLNSKMCFYGWHYEEFKDLSSQENGVLFCKDVCLVMEVLVHEYNPD